MSVADVPVVLGRAFVGGMMVSLPFAALLAAGQGSTAASARARGRARARQQAESGCRTGQAGDGRGRVPRAAVGRRERAAERSGPDAFYAAQLRRAALIVRLFAAASPGGEKEAVYQALVRLAAAVNQRRAAGDRAVPFAAAPVTPSVTPGRLYRALTRGGARAVSDTPASTVAFDAWTCAELDARDRAAR